MTGVEKVKSVNHQAKMLAAKCAPKLKNGSQIHQAR